MKIIFSHPHFSNQNPRQMVHLVLDDLGREPREFQRLRLEIHVLEFHMDEEFAGHKIGIHPNDNTATVWLQADDLLELIRKQGNDAALIRICGSAPTP